MLCFLRNVYKLRCDSEVILYHGAMKSLGILFFVLLGVIVGAWLWPEDQQLSSIVSPTPTPPEASPSVSVTPSPTTVSATSTSPAPSATPEASKNYTITIRSSGVSPQELTIRPGDSVTFVNESAEGAWPASDPHPSHTLCPFFDADKRMAIGETYSVTFPRAQTCSFHNHTNPSSAFKGVIRVR